MTISEQTPAKVVAALTHVCLHHLNVTSVIFAQENPECGGFWEYVTADGEAPTFGPEIDVSLLEDALDAAWEDRTFPATYHIA